MNFLNTFFDYTFVRRVRRLTSKPGVAPDELIKPILGKNGFPERVIAALLAPVLSVVQRERSSLPSTVEGVSAPMYRVLPYVRGISERLKKVLKREIDCKITLVPLEKTKRYFTKTKDPVQKELRSNVIYEIPCGGCNLRYIGTTIQYLKKRLQKHKYDCRPPIQNPHVSSLCLHTHDTGHHFTLSETKILDGHKNTSVRYMLGALHIKENIQHLVNKRTDFDRVNDIYAQLLDRRQ
ncbi:uncharacterized protein DMENIID0001_056040 [Sergentomyia squamirostris]